jgi:hypothetical protein
LTNWRLLLFLILFLFSQQAQAAAQGSLINAAPPTTVTTTTITQPFSPTTQNLVAMSVTEMSESDLISFINPSVFM